MDSTTASPTPAVKLTSVEHWSKTPTGLRLWSLRQTAEGQNIWHKVDPDMPEQDSDLLKKPVMPSTVIFHEYVKKDKTVVHTPSMLETIQYYNVIHQKECRKYKTQEAKQTMIHK
ncbi:hypothetical protein E4U22_007428 [Claviceps purpurea]|nr:hypothetical protein E4U22_007428 [Claviceps purpurea]